MNRIDNPHETSGFWPLFLFLYGGVCNKLKKQAGLKLLSPIIDYNVSKTILTK
jgi:hypothetical protein